MTKIDIFSGFLGAGKTTLIKKLIQEAYKNEQVVLIENEFGEIGIDGGFMKEAGIQVNELNSGCICCSLVGDFAEALQKVVDEYHPDRVLIEPSGVGKLSDIIVAVQKANTKDAVLNSFVTVADANKCKMYMKNFGEFYNNQVENASTIILSRTAGIKEEKLNTALEIIRGLNEKATIITTPWDEISGEQILAAMENVSSLQNEMAEMAAEMHEHHHDDECCCHDHEHHHHDDECCCHDHEHHDDECCCHDHEHHHHDDECCCHDHEHHHHDDECCCHDHEHHHHDDECCCHDHEHHHHDDECTCGCHGHHHHHADEIFTSWGRETPNKYTMEQIEKCLKELDSGKYGAILRAKGIVAGADGKWIHFDYVPEEASVRNGAADVTGRLCVIGSKLDEAAVAELFGVK